jgi:hypothetical protein
MTPQETDDLWYEEEMILTLKFERAWADDKTLKFTDIYQEDLCGAGLRVRPELGHVLIKLSRHTSAPSRKRTRCPAICMSALGQKSACFIVKDANGFAVSYVYFESEPGRRTATNPGHIAKL